MGGGTVIHMKATTTAVHERKHRILIDAKSLKQIIAERAAKAVNGHPDVTGAGVTYKVEFEDETEGSPPYKVGTKCVVTIIEDMSPQAEAGR